MSMKTRTGAVLALLAAALTLCACAAGVQFKSRSVPSGQELTLEGSLYRPEGKGPFPAVLVLHPCGGINSALHASALTIRQQGYVVLVLDSFGPRGIAETCSGKASIAAADRAMDAHSARAYLAGLPFVDKERIALMGWSYGATSALHALNPGLVETLPLAERRPFRAAALYYPHCSTPLENLPTPLLILIGEKDDWTPARLCRQRLPPPGGPREVTLKVYPGAYHGFDQAGYRTGFFQGHYIAYDAEAQADAARQVEAFLARHLQGE